MSPSLSLQTHTHTRIVNVHSRETLKVMGWQNIALSAIKQNWWLKMVIGGGEKINVKCRLHICTKTRSCSPSLSLALIYRHTHKCSCLLWLAVIYRLKYRIRLALIERSPYLLQFWVKLLLEFFQLSLALHDSANSNCNRIWKREVI
jgi:hypothetical protein